MFACMFLGIALFQNYLFWSIISFAGVFYFGNKVGTRDEATFEGWLFILAVIGVLITWISYLFQ
jgi:hypothetical protein